MKLNTKLRRIIASMLAFVMCLGVMSNTFAVSALGATVTENDNKGVTNCEVTYNIESKWDGGYNASITITNKSSQVVNNWRLVFALEDKIVNIWNAVVASHEGSNYVVKNAQWNQDIQPYCSVSFGFIAEGAGEKEPLGMKILSSEQVVNQNLYSVEYGLNSDWGDGYSAYISITNNASVAIEDWTLEFDFNRNIDSMWNGTVISHSDNHYVVTNLEYIQNINPGESIVIGFNGTLGTREDVASNFVLKSYNAVTNGNISEEKKVEIDKSKMYADKTGIYYLADDFKDLCGSVKEYKSLSKLSYVNKNVKGTILDSGDINIAENWKVDDIKLVVGYNEITVTAEYSDGKIYNDSVVLANSDESKMSGLNIDLSDNDSDGLNNYLEDIYGTNKDKADTDEDGLSDYIELVEIGTSAFVVDTDEDGIADIDEDSDGDMLTNKEELAVSTYLYAKDTDADGLTDYEEVKVYGTNPLVKDTDGDGVDDKWEVEHGFKATVAETSFTVVDTVVSDNVKYEITITASGENIASFEAQVKDHNLINSTIAGYISKAVDFKIDGNFEKATVKVYFDESYLQDKDFVPALYYVNEETKMLEEVSSEWDGKSNYITVELAHFSSYVFLNKKQFKKIWDNRIRAVAMSQTGNTNLNVMLVVDVSASMKTSSRLSTMKSAMGAFVGVLKKNDRVGLVSFNDTATIRSGLTADKALVKTKIISLNTNGNTAIYSGLSSAVNILKTDNNPGCDVVILFTDGQDMSYITYESHYASIVKTAQEAGIVIEVVGAGSPNHPILTKVAQSTGGNYYYANDSGEIAEMIGNAQQDVIDMTTDSNNDGISDYYTKLLCNYELLSSSGTIVSVTADYDTIQKNADLDGDGIKNGDEYVICEDRDGKVYVDIKTEMNNPDTDYDGYTDGNERNMGSNPNEYDILRSDLSVYADDDNYSASLISEEFDAGGWFKIQLYAANILTNCKVLFVFDYKRALLEFISVYSKETLSNSTIEGVLDKYESDMVEISENIVEIISICKKEMINCAELEVLNKEIERLIEGVKTSQKRMSIIEDNIAEWYKLEGEFAKDYDDWYRKEGKRLYELAKAKYNLKSIDTKKIFKFSVDLSDKTKQIAKCAGKVVEGLGTSFTIADGLADIYKTYKAYSAIDAECAQYEYIEEMLKDIIIYNENYGVKAAALEISSAIEADSDRLLQEVTAIMVNMITTGTELGIEEGIDRLTIKFGPLVWAIDAGISIGDMMFGTSAVVEETLRIIALGDAARTWNFAVTRYLKADTSLFYNYTPVCGREHLQLLGQLRICGEDAVARGNDESGIVKKGINRVIYGPQSKYEEYLKSSIDKVVQVSFKYNIIVAKYFDGSYLYK